MISVSKAGMATLALGRFLAPHIQKGGVKALSHFVEQSEEKSQKQMKIVSEVASGSVAAVSTVYMALENSSKILAKNIGENTVEVVKHRYGTEAGFTFEHLRPQITAHRTQSLKFKALGRFFESRKSFMTLQLFKIIE